MDLIKSLKDICDGKIYVESESAKLHFMLSKMYEEKGNLDSACEIVQDVHVETYGSLSKKEKADFILEQIRLNLLKKDYIRALIHSRKVYQCMHTYIHTYISICIQLRMHISLCIFTSSYLVTHLYVYMYNVCVYVIEYYDVFSMNYQMNLKTIEETGFEEVKVKFYRMMIEYHMVEKNTWEIAQAYYKIANTPMLATVSGSPDGAVEMKEDDPNS